MFPPLNIFPVLDKPEMMKQNIKRLKEQLHRMSSLTVEGLEFQRIYEETCKYGSSQFNFINKEGEYMKNINVHLPFNLSPCQDEQIKRLSLLERQLSETVDDCLNVLERNDLCVKGESLHYGKVNMKTAFMYLVRAIVEAERVQKVRGEFHCSDYKEKN